MIDTCAARPDRNQEQDWLKTNLAIHAHAAGPARFS